MSSCVSRRRFLGLTGAGVATVAGVGVLYGLQRITADGGGDRSGATFAATGPTPQKIVVETRYTPAGVPYLAAVALDRGSSRR